MASVPFLIMVAVVSGMGVSHILVELPRICLPYSCYSHIEGSFVPFYSTTVLSIL